MIEYRERRYSAFDGRSLYYREYGDPLAPSPSILCLPGFSRNSRDFHTLACHLSEKRRIVCPDYRGRGRSDYDGNPANYHPRVLLDDLRHLLTASGLDEFVAIGTSMGGILAMAFGAVAPSALQGAILNDIGPEVGASALETVLTYIGRDNPQASWEEAEATLRRMMPGLNLRTPDDWRAATEGTFREGADGKLHIDWDPKIVRSMNHRERQMDLWPLFRSLRRKPVLAFRGEVSKILEPATFEEMREQHPQMTAVTIPGAGHTPSLNEPEARVAIDAFLEEILSAAPLAGR